MFLASSARSFPWYETAITSAKITKGFQWPAVDLPDMELVAAEDGNLKFAASVCEHSWNDSATFRQHREMNCFVEVAGLASPRAEYAAAAKAGKHDMKNYKKRAGFLEKFMAGLADCSTHAEKIRRLASLHFSSTSSRLPGSSLQFCIPCPLMLLGKPRSSAQGMLSPMIFALPHTLTHSTPLPRWTLQPS